MRACFVQLCEAVVAAGVKPVQMALFVWGPVGLVELEEMGDQGDGAVPELLSKAGRRISPKQEDVVVRAVIDVIETTGSVVSLDLRYELSLC